MRPDSLPCHMDNITAVYFFTLASSFCQDFLQYHDTGEDYCSHCMVYFIIGASLGFLQCHTTGQDYCSHCILLHCDFLQFFLQCYATGWDYCSQCRLLHLNFDGFSYNVMPLDWITAVTIYFFTGTSCGFPSVSCQCVGLLLSLYTSLLCHLSWHCSSNI